MLLKNSKQFLPILLFIFLGVESIYYFNSIGIMDDPKIIYQIVYDFKLNLNIGDLLSTFFNYINNEVSRGGFQILLFPQWLIQGIPYLLLKVQGYYLFNLLIVYLSIYIFLKGVNLFYEINLGSCFALFFCWPYFYDSIVHPSLQQKIIFLFIGLLLLELKRTKPRFFLVIIYSFLIPFIKLQGVVLFMIVFTIYIYRRSEVFLYSLVSTSLANVIILYVYLNNEGSYFSRGFNFEIFQGNFIGIPLALTVFGISCIIFHKLLNLHIPIYLGLALGLILLCLLISVSRSSFSYISISYVYLFVPLIYISYNELSAILREKFSFDLSKLFHISVILLFATVHYLFALPRYERWHGLGETIETISTLNEDKVIYHTCLEAPQRFNQILANEYKVSPKPIEPLGDGYEKLNKEIAGGNFLLVVDPYDCDQTKKEKIKESCKVVKDYSKDYRYDEVKLIEYQC